MSEKAILILADGLRPDAMISCGHPFVEKMKERAAERGYHEAEKLPYPSSSFHKSPQCVLPKVYSAGGIIILPENYSCRARGYVI